MKAGGFLAVAVFGLAACAAPGPILADGFAETRPSVRVLVMPPDVEIALMTLSGEQAPAEWNRAAERQLMAALIAALEAGGEDVQVFRADAAGAEAARQLRLLHAAVIGSIMSHVVEIDPDRFAGPLAHKRPGELDYTLGEGLAALAGQQRADYGLFLSSRARVESGGVMVSKLLVGVATGQAPPGHGYEGTLVSLVEMQRGRLVWLGFTAKGDPRDPKAAAKIIRRIFAQSPLD